MAGRIRLIEKSSDLIGNRSRDLPASSIVHQLTTPPHGSMGLCRLSVWSALAVRNVEVMWGYIFK
jgi:hypothetical protein